MKQPASCQPSPSKKIFYGWTIVGVTFLIGLTQAGVFQNVLSIFLKPMAQEFGWNRSMITGSIAAGSLAGGIISPFFGPYLDRYGPRKLAFWGITVLSGGLITLYWLSSIWQLYLFFGTGRMIASGLLSLVVTVSVSNWFIEKRGRAMGIAQLGSRIGIATLPLLVQFLILGFGWRMAWAVLGLVVFSLSAIPSLLFLKRRSEDIGLLPDGREEGLTKDAENISSKSENDRDQIQSLENEPIWKRQQIFRTLVFWQLVTVMCIISFTGAGSNFHMYPFLTDHGLAPEVSVLVITVISACSAVGGVIIGFLAERISIQKLLAAVLISLGCVFFSLFWVVENKILVFGFAFVYGMIRGGVIPLIFLVWADFYGRLSSGTVLSLASPFRATTNALGPVFAAACFDIMNHYWIPFSLFSFLLVLAGLITLTTKAPVYPKQMGSRLY